MHGLLLACYATLHQSHGHKSALQIYPQGSGDSDALEAEPDQLEPPTLSRSLGRAKSLDPKTYMLTAESEGRVHSKAYPTSSQLQAGSNLSRFKFPKIHAPVTSAPVWVVEDLEGQIHGGLPKAASHPDNLADLANIGATDAVSSPFAR